MTLAEEAAAQPRPVDLAQLFARRFAQAAAGSGEGLPEFAEACRAMLDPGAPPAPRPFALLGAARALLRQRANWGDDEAATPTPKLLAALDALIEAARAATDPPVAAPALVAGLRAYAAGDPVAAWAGLSAAGRAPDYPALRMTGDLTGPLRFVPPFPTSAALAGATSPARPLRWLRTFEVAPRLVVSVGCDQLYAEAFVPDWIGSMPAIAAAGVGLHINVIFGGEEDAALIEGIACAAEAAGIDLAVSTEASAGWELAYFASSRFMHARALLEAFGCPVFLSDADMQVTNPAHLVARALPGMLASAQVMAVIDPPWQNAYVPWRRIAAGAVLLPANANGMAFAGAAAGCLAHAWDPARGPLWWIDQLALETARLALLREGSAAARLVNFRSLPSRAIVRPAGWKEARLAASPRVAAGIARGMSYRAALGAARENLRLGTADR